MRKFLALLLVAASALAGSVLVACGDDTAVPPTDSGSDSHVTMDGPGPMDSPAGDTNPGNDAGDGGCVDEAGGFVCCVENMIDNHTTNTDKPDPGFCNMGDTMDPTAFKKYFP
jgi:hypothetical protein